MSCKSLTSFYMVLRKVSFKILLSPASKQHLIKCQILSVAKHEDISDFFDNCFLTSSVLCTT